jgi:glycosyltransferase involved in cell wall biosynthesis
MQLTIVCATFNAREAVQLTLMSLRNCLPFETRVLVADNGSTDGTLAHLESQEWLTVAPLSARPGAATDHGSTLDWLAEQVTTPYFLTLDSDVELLTRNCLDDMLALAQAEGLDALGVYEPAIGAYRTRLAPYALLLRTATFRALDTSFRSFARIDDPLEAARWRARPPSEDLPLSEMESYRTAAFYPTAAALFERLTQRGDHWANLSPAIAARVRHYGHMSWARDAQHRDRQAYIRRRLKRLERRSRTARAARL